MRSIAFAALGMILTASVSSLASELASATIAETGKTGSNFDYSITLQDIGTTTVGTFWYSWIPGLDFMKSSPISVTSPSGWTDSITNAGGSDGYAIRFTANAAGDYIQSGSSLAFSFISPDNPDVITGNSSTHPTYNVGTSYIYSAGAFSDSGDQFIVTAAPEPGSFGLIAAATGAMLSRRRKG